MWGDRDVGVDLTDSSDQWKLKLTRLPKRTIYLSDGGHIIDVEVLFDI